MKTKKRKVCFNLQKIIVSSIFENIGAKDVYILKQQKMKLSIGNLIVKKNSYLNKKEIISK